MIPSHRLILYFMPRSSRCTTGSISRCVLSPRKPVSTVPYRLPVIVLRSPLFYMSIAFRPPIHPYCERRFRKPAQTVYLFSYLFVFKIPDSPAPPRCDGDHKARCRPNLHLFQSSHDRRVISVRLKYRVVYHIPEFCILNGSLLRVSSFI